MHLEPALPLESAAALVPGTKRRTRAPVFIRPPAKSPGGNGETSDPATLDPLVFGVGKATSEIDSQSC